MKTIKITLSLCAVMALTLAAPMASAHCGTCGVGEKHEKKEGEKECCKDKEKKKDKKDTEKSEKTEEKKS